MYTPPVQWLIGGRFPKKVMSKIESGVYYKPLESMMQCANILTEGFTKSAHGWVRWDVKGSLENRFHHLCKFQHGQQDDNSKR